MTPYTAPAEKLSAFHCPHCAAYSNQAWGMAFANPFQDRLADVPGLHVCVCYHCRKRSIWYQGVMLYPTDGAAPIPNRDLPADIRDDYEEARSIVAASPRGAAALLRLAIQKLCAHLGEKGKNINDDIASLVKKGLPVPVQQALDVVRVVGNNAVHPGQIDLQDTPETVQTLFGLINIIADVMISQPKHIAALYQSLPQGQLDAIAKRDGQS